MATKPAKPNTYDMEGHREKVVLLKEDLIIIQMASEMAAGTAVHPIPDRNSMILFASLTYRNRGGKIDCSKHIGAPIAAVKAVIAESEEATSE